MQLNLCSLTSKLSCVNLVLHKMSVKSNLNYDLCTVYYKTSSVCMWIHISINFTCMKLKCQPRPRIHLLLVNTVTWLRWDWVHVISGKRLSLQLGLWPVTVRLDKLWNRVWVSDTVVTGTGRWSEVKSRGKSHTKISHSLA